jgi:hypothetical protein
MVRPLCALIVCTAIKGRKAQGGAGYAFVACVVVGARRHVLSECRRASRLVEAWLGREETMGLVNEFLDGRAS